MTQFLKGGTRKFIESRMKRGGYATADALVVAALTSLDQQQRFGDFARGELEKLLLEGEASGRFVDGAKALAARRRRREQGRPGRRQQSA